MKIISLTAENVKKLVAIEIRPGGNMVQITGKNGQGKTSVLDSIWWALAGAGNVQSTPIRKGAEKAKIRLDLGEIIVTRTFKPGKDGNATTAIKVENEKGARFQSPQAMLDDLLGSLAFDPLAFARMSPRQQFDELKSFVPDIDFDEIETAYKIDYDARADINRVIKELEAQLQEIPIPDVIPKKRIIESELLAKLADAANHNSTIEIQKARRQDIFKEIERSENQIEFFKNKMTTLQIELDESYQLPDLIDTENLKNEVEDARRINEIMDDIDKRNRRLNTISKRKQELDLIIERMRDRMVKKHNAISKAKLPVKRISFGDNEILLNDVPFDQASDSEQLKASLSIAMASNPKLRVIRVRDGSLLDEDSLRMISEMAETKDFQVWIECVTNGENVGIVLEDGKLKGGK